MKITTEQTLVNFNTWSGATETKKAIINAGKTEEFDSLIEELYPDGIDETQLNDLIWFESDWIFESLGITKEEEETEEENNTDES